jgi:Flp pilus assembly protein TadG
MHCLKLIRDRYADIPAWRARLKGIVGERSGASAVEFAFIAPILLSIYVSSFEITEGYTAASKVLKAAGTVADVVARQASVDKAFLSTMVEAAEATIAPHSTDELELKITGISIDSAGNPSVLWSWDEDGNAPYTKGTSVTVPDDMKIASSFLVHAELSVPHTLLLFLSSGTGLASETRTITLTRDFYYRQRLSEDIACSDCS